MSLSTLLKPGSEIRGTNRVQFRGEAKFLQVGSAIQMTSDYSMTSLYKMLSNGSVDFGLRHYTKLANLFIVSLLVEGRGKNVVRTLDYLDWGTSLGSTRRFWSDVEQRQKCS